MAEGGRTRRIVAFPASRGRGRCALGQRGYHRRRGPSKFARDHTEKPDVAAPAEFACLSLALTRAAGGAPSTRPLPACRYPFTRPASTNTGQRRATPTEGGTRHDCCATSRRPPAGAEIAREPVEGPINRTRNGRLNRRQGYFQRARDGRTGTFTGRRGRGKDPRGLPARSGPTGDPPRRRARFPPLHHAGPRGGVCSPTT